MNKKKTLSIISILLIMVGVIIIFLPEISSKIIEKRTANNVDQVENISSENLQSNLDTETEFDFDSIREIDPSQTLLSSNDIDENLILGRLFIPSIDLNLTVYNGVTNEILHAGLGTMRPDLEMGKGNFPIAGHYSRKDDLLFGNLTGVQLNDSIYLTDNDQVYEYKVYERKVVQPNDVHWIDNQVAEDRGKAIISLMNCYYVDGEYTDKRFFVFAELVDSYPADSEIN